MLQDNEQKKVLTMKLRSLILEISTKFGNNAAVYGGAQKSMRNNETQ